MEYRLRDVIDSLDYTELLNIQKDLDNGGHHLKNFIESRVKQREQEHAKICSNCQSDIDPNSTSNYTLIFGPHDLRKKATFCALDCMNYFLKRLEVMKMEKHTRDEVPE